MISNLCLNTLDAKTRKPDSTVIRDSTVNHHRSTLNANSHQSYNLWPILWVDVLESLKLRLLHDSSSDIEQSP